MKCAYCDNIVDKDDNINNNGKKVCQYCFFKNKKIILRGKRK